MVCRLGAVIPFTSLQTTPCEVTLEDVVIHVQLLSPTQLQQQRTMEQQNDSAARQPSGEHAGTFPSAPSPADDEEEAVLGGSSIADGVRLIADGIETLLHQLRVTVRNLSVHIVAPPEHPGGQQVRLLVSLAAFDFCSRDQLPNAVQTSSSKGEVAGRGGKGGGGGDGSKPSGGDGGTSKSLLLDKHCSFEGLLLELTVNAVEQDGVGGNVEEGGAGEDGIAGVGDEDDAGYSSTEGGEVDIASSCIEDDEGDCCIGARGSPGKQHTTIPSASAAESSSPSPPPALDTPHVGVLLCNNQGAGCSAAMHVRLESSDGLQSGSVAVDVHVDPMQVQVHSAHVAYLCMLVHRAAAGAGAGKRDSARNAGGGGRDKEKSQAGVTTTTTRCE